MLATWMTSNLQRIDDELLMCLRELRMLQSKTVTHKGLFKDGMCVQETRMLQSSNVTQEVSFKTVLTEIKKAAVEIAKHNHETFTLYLFNTIISSAAESMETRMNKLNIEKNDEWGKVLKEIKWIHRMLTTLEPAAILIGTELTHTRLTDTCENVKKAIYINDEQAFLSTKTDERNRLLINILSSVGKRLHQSDTTYYEFQGKDGARRMNEIIDYLNKLAP
jgi:hypothetical protein